MRPAVLAFVAIAACSCHACKAKSLPAEDTYLVALGARFEPLALRDGCRPADVTPPGIVRFSSPSGLALDAVSAGVARVPCKDGMLAFDVRPVTKIDIGAPAEVALGDDVVLRAIAFDTAGRELALGSDTPLMWTFAGALAERPWPGCGDILPICPARNAGYARAAARGTGTATVSFLGATHSRDIVVR